MCARGVRTSMTSRSDGETGRAQLRPRSELEIRKRREHVEQAKNNSICRVFAQETTGVEPKYARILLAIARAGQFNETVEWQTGAATRRRRTKTRT